MGEQQISASSLRTGMMASPAVMVGASAPWRKVKRTAYAGPGRTLIEWYSGGTSTVASSAQYKVRP